ncbi:MAG: hypothetical protein ABR530_04240 [Pyrinomonadaceae bacterium]
MRITDRVGHPPVISSFWLSSLFLIFPLINSCSVAEPKTSANTRIPVSSRSGSSTAADSVKGATIPIEINGPADTVRVFYKNLREKKFREAIFLTNLRPAIEGLTESELKDFSLDFEAIAGTIPAEVEINGEIIGGDNATVTANLPNDDSGKPEVQKLKLRRINDVWIIQTVDGDAEIRIRKEGKNYFYNLRIGVHEDEARKMLERISKAQLAYSLQHGGRYADMQELIGTGLLADDANSSESTGYNYAIVLAAENRSYYATATPAIYEKSGKLSFILNLDGKGMSRVTSRDIAGKTLSK